MIGPPEPDRFCSQWIAKIPEAIARLEPASAIRISRMSTLRLVSHRALLIVVVVTELYAD